MQYVLPAVHLFLICDMGRNILNILAEASTDQSLLYRNMQVRENDYFF
jgi:hypothetical protein